MENGLKMIDGPRMIHKNKDNDIHNTNGPAMIFHTTNEWALNEWALWGKKHRYYGNQNNYQDTWFLHGKQIK